jgi:hypothetical protein
LRRCAKVSTAQVVPALRWIGASARRAAARHHLQRSRTALAVSTCRVVSLPLVHAHWRMRTGVLAAYNFLALALCHAHLRHPVSEDVVQGRAVYRRLMFADPSSKGKGAKRSAHGSRDVVGRVVQAHAVPESLEAAQAEVLRLRAQMAARSQVRVPQSPAVVAVVFRRRPCGGLRMRICVQCMCCVFFVCLMFH